MQRYRAAIAALMLFLVATGSFTFSNRVPPDRAANANRIVFFGANSDNFSGFLLYAERENADTSGFQANVSSAGEPIPVDSRVVGPYVHVAGSDTGAETCTLKVWTTSHAGSGTTLVFQHIFTSPGTELMPDSTFDVSAGDVLSAYLGTTGTGVKSPHAYFPMAPR